MPLTFEQLHLVFSLKFNITGYNSIEIKRIAFTEIKVIFHPKNDEDRRH